MKKRAGKENQKAGPVSAVILAAGSSSRMQGRDKLAAVLGGESVIRRSLRAFQDCALVDEIVVVLRRGGEQPVLAACEGLDKVRRIVQGGDSRTVSACRGVMAADKTARIILIHDGARPLVSDAVIRAVIAGAETYGAAVPVVPVTDTIKTGADGFVTGTPDRADLFAAQTPQGFRAELIKAALSDAVAKNLTLTDDCAAVERLGMRVRLVAGDSRNRKLTTPEDLTLAAALLGEEATV